MIKMVVTKENFEEVFKPLIRKNVKYNWSSLSPYNFKTNIYDFFIDSVELKDSSDRLLYDGKYKNGDEFVSMRAVSMSDGTVHHIGIDLPFSAFPRKGGLVIMPDNYEKIGGVMITITVAYAGDVKVSYLNGKPVYVNTNGLDTLEYEEHEQREHFGWLTKTVTTQLRITHQFYKLEVQDLGFLAHRIGGKINKDMKVDENTCDLSDIKQGEFFYISVEDIGGPFMCCDDKSKRLLRCDKPLFEEDGKKYIMVSSFKEIPHSVDAILEAH